MYSGWLTQRTPVDLMMDVCWATKRPFYGWGRRPSAGTEGTMLSQRSCPPVPARWTIITGMKCSKTNQVCFYPTFSVTVTLNELRYTTLRRLSNTEKYFLTGSVDWSVFLAFFFSRQTFLRCGMEPWEHFVTVNLNEKQHRLSLCFSLQWLWILPSGEQLRVCWAGGDEGPSSGVLSERDHRTATDHWVRTYVKHDDVDYKLRGQQRGQQSLR